MMQVIETRLKLPGRLHKQPKPETLSCLYNNMEIAKTWPWHVSVHSLNPSKQTRVEFLQVHRESCRRNHQEQDKSYILKWGSVILIVSLTLKRKGPSHTNDEDDAMPHSFFKPKKKKKFHSLFPNSHPLGLFKKFRPCLPPQNNYPLLSLLMGWRESTSKRGPLLKLIGNIISGSHTPTLLR